MKIICAICSDFVRPKKDLCANNCGHGFHYKCIRKWIEKSKTCPVCGKICTENHLIRLHLKTKEQKEPNPRQNLGQHYQLYLEEMRICNDEEKAYLRRALVEEQNKHGMKLWKRLCILGVFGGIFYLYARRFVVFSVHVAPPGGWKHFLNKSTNSLIVSLLIHRRMN